MPKDQEKVRQRAYEIWDREGRQDGRAEEHWAQAEREIGASPTNLTAGVRNDVGAPAQAHKSGNGATTSIGVKPPSTAPRKRRGAQPVNQG
jgi:hypothetical protein